MPVISHIQLKVPLLDPPPPGLVESLIDAWVKGNIQSIIKRQKHLKKAIPNIKAVIAKIIKPGLAKAKASIRPGYVNIHGIKTEELLSPSRAELEKWARQWLKKTKLGLDPTRLIEAILHKAINYAKTMLQRVIPFRGYKDIVPGLARLAADWLTGKVSVLKLIPQEEIIKGEPIDIIKPGQTAKFRKAFTNQIVSVGSRIINLGYLAHTIKKGNAKINKLVSACTRPSLVPSVNFIIEDEQLFLEVQVSVPD